MTQHQPNREAFYQAIHEIALGIHGGGWIESKFNEASVRQAIVLRLLEAAGFNIWNPLEVSPEESSHNGGRIDLSVRSNGKLLFFLELKRLNAVIEGKGTVQAINYANSEGIQWAIATNGTVWRIYDAHQRKPSSERCVLEIQLTQHNQDEFADDLYRLLDASVWAKNGFEKSVNLVLRDKEVRSIVAEKTIAIKIELEKQMIINSSVIKNDSLLLSNTEKPLLICKGRDKAYATAVLLEDGGLEVQVGSRTAREVIKQRKKESLEAFKERQRKWCDYRGSLVETKNGEINPNGHFIYLKPFEYEKPSSASAFILGRSSRGTKEWKTSDGKTYADLTQP